MLLFTVFDTCRDSNSVLFLCVCNVYGYLKLDFFWKRKARRLIELLLKCLQLRDTICVEACHPQFLIYQNRKVGRLSFFFSCFSLVFFFADNFNRSCFNRISSWFLVYLNIMHIITIFDSFRLHYLLNDKTYCNWYNKFHFVTIRFYFANKALKNRFKSFVLSFWLICYSFYMMKHSIRNVEKLLLIFNRIIRQRYFLVYFIL